MTFLLNNNVKNEVDEIAHIDYNVISEVNT